MLSKPKSPPSLGSRSVTSIVTPSRSRTAFAYSVRFRRWRTNLPGLFFFAAARVEAGDERRRGTSSAPRRPGVGEPCGGIAPTPSFLTTRSHVAASAPGSAKLALSSASGAPAGSGLRVLWQPTQYCASPSAEIGRCVARLRRAGVGLPPARAVALARRLRRDRPARRRLRCDARRASPASTRTRRRAPSSLLRSLASVVRRRSRWRCRRQAHQLAQQLRDVLLARAATATAAVLRAAARRARPAGARPAACLRRRPAR